MYNLKKYAEKEISVFNNMLNNKRDEQGTVSNDESGNYEYRLDDDRNSKSEDDNVSYQKLLDQSRSENDGLSITESAMNKKDKGKFNMADYRSDKTSNVPLMDYNIEAEHTLRKENEKNIKKEQSNQDRDTSFWDDFVGKQLPEELKTEIVRNLAPSQLVSNYDSRDEFEKENNSIKKASVNSLKDADAMIYSIYRFAYDNNREINAEEQQIINDINSSKARVLLAQDYDDDYRNDQSDIKADELEEELDNLKDIEEDEKECKECKK